MDLFSTLQSYLTILQTQAIATFLYIPLALIILDVITGVLASLKQGVFSFKELFTFLRVNVLPYLLIVCVVFVVYCVSGNTLAAQVSILLGMGVHGVSILGSILENLKELQVPAPLIKELETVGQSYFQGYPPTVSAPIQEPAYPTYVPPAPVLVPQPIEKQATQVVPSMPEVVRVSTPPLVVPPSPDPLVPPLITLPQGL